ncbi:hypothetical protein ACT44V_02560 [Acinetobacter baumannii]
MNVFPITLNDEIKQTAVVMDSLELRRIIAEAIAGKLGIDINNENNSFLYTNFENFKHLVTGDYEAIAVAIHFIEKVDSDA